MTDQTQQPTVFQQNAAQNPETSTPAPTSQPSEAPRPGPDPAEFAGSGPDIEGAVADFIAIQEEDEPSPAERRAAEATPNVQQVPPAQVAPAPTVPPVTAQPVVTPEAVPPVVQQPAPAAQPTPQAQPVPVQQPAPAVDPNAQQPTPQQTPPVVAPQPGVPAPGEFAQLAQAVAQQRTALEGSLAQMYTPSPQEMEEFIEKPELTLGKLAAKLHMEIVQNTLGVLAQNIPAAVTGVLQAQKINDEREQAFFTKWPQLNPKDPVHMQTVQQIARAYAQANPSADANTRLTQIGAQAIVALGLLPTQAPAPQAQPQANKQVPFAPAGNGTVAPAPVAVPTGWEAINQLMDADEF